MSIFFLSVSARACPTLIGPPAPPHVTAPPAESQPRSRSSGVIARVGPPRAAAAAAGVGGCGAPARSQRARDVGQVGEVGDVGRRRRKGKGGGAWVSGRGEGGWCGWRPISLLPVGLLGCYDSAIQGPIDDAQARHCRSLRFAVGENGSVERSTYEGE